MTSKKYMKFVTLASSLALGLSAVAAPVLSTTSNSELQNVQAASKTLQDELNAAFPKTEVSMATDEIKTAMSVTNEDGTTVNAFDAFLDGQTAKYAEYTTAQKDPFMQKLGTLAGENLAGHKIAFTYASNALIPEGLNANALRQQMERLVAGDQVTFTVAAQSNEVGGDASREITLTVAGNPTTGDKTDLTAKNVVVANGTIAGSQEAPTVNAAAILNENELTPFSGADVANAAAVDGSGYFYAKAGEINAANFRRTADSNLINPNTGKFVDNKNLIQLIPVPYTKTVASLYNFSYYLNPTNHQVTNTAPTPGNDAIAFVARTITVGNIEESAKPVFTYALNGQTPITYADGITLTTSQLNPIDNADLTFEADSGTAAKLVLNLNDKVLSANGLLKGYETATTTGLAKTFNEVKENDVKNVKFDQTGTYKVPVSVTNTDNGVTSTIYLPVTITADKNVPVFEWSNSAGQDIVLTNSLHKFDLLDNLVVKSSSNVDAETLVPTVKVVKDGKIVATPNNKLDCSIQGVYEVTYTAKNAAGKVATHTINIQITGEGNGNSNQGEYDYDELETVGVINYMPGFGTLVYSAPNGQATSQYLEHGTAWKILGKAEMKSDGAIWYEVGHNQWIRAAYVLIGQTSLNEGNVTEMSSIARISYVPGYGVNLWNGYGAKAEFSGRRLIHGSEWKVFKKAVAADGTTWYNVGGDQWVLSEYVVLV